MTGPGTGEPAAHVGTRDLEDMRQARADQDAIDELVAAAGECVFLFTAADGWLAGVTMSYLHEDGVFWLAAVTDRQHARAVERDSRVGMVISNRGTDLPGRRMVRIKGRATLHRDRATLDRMLPRLAATLAPAGAEQLHRLLDSPKRVLIRVQTLSYPQSHDSRNVAGDGRGGTRETAGGA
ncbi:Pyridoxamine 5'-phosphate oxidase [Pseudonocardia ammonioxydans]|uniref:Pyridoxamine 5'-phosphate oxidase n=1 Tax=Pseudonocardia ammonioxydans TaxID=260086 RepID=A0A1I4XHJ8_PSUAM|nr:pyridoxamine 5'-phosphate oxidase family protein [Pseudonocardia ammonioxydans]SFN25334.1 Pyridoxamine 5'-phosphate oxidase [Pseudonocardia ammonioxydans]